MIDVSIFALSDDTSNDDSIDVTSSRPGETNLDTTEHEVQVETGSPTGGTGLSGSGDVSQASHAPSDEVPPISI